MHVHGHNQTSEIELFTCSLHACVVMHAYIQCHVCIAMYIAGEFPYVQCHIILKT